MLEIKNLCKQYGKLKVLKNLNFKFEHGIYGILGPNGAGKSTLMNLISDITDRSSGSIEYDGKDIKVLKDEYRKKIGYLPQNIGLYPEFTLEETLEYFAYLRGVNKSETESRICDVLEYTNLSLKRKDKVGTFSGGMKRRAAIAITLIGNPELIIFDEPTVGLDPKERIRFRELLLKIKQDKIILLSSHIVSDLDKVADNILIMKDGRIVDDVENNNVDLEDKYMMFFKDDE